MASAPNMAHTSMFMASIVMASIAMASTRRIRSGHGEHIYSYGLYAYGLDPPYSLRAWRTQVYVHAHKCVEHRPLSQYTCPVRHMSTYVYK